MKLDAVPMRTRRFSSPLSLGLLVACMIAAGCSSSKTEEVPYLSQLVPVSGTVKLNGQPTEYVSVIFHPVDDGGTEYYVASATTAADGSFKPSTPPGGATNLKKYAGMLPGKYKVTLSYWKFPDGKPFNPVTSNEGPMNVGAIDVIPVNYSNPTTTPLQVEVTAGQSTPLDFDIKIK